MTRDEALALLGLPAEATGADVQRAFLRAARRVHPDVLPGAGEGERRAAGERFDALVQARAVLLDPAAVPFDTPNRPFPAGPSPGTVRARSAEGPRRDLANSLVVIALLSFLIVALVTVDGALRGATPAPAGSGSPAGRSATP
jgi:hypothetical protein